jgi:hypothetical protein
MDGENPAATQPAGDRSAAGDVPVTGNEKVDAAITRLASLGEWPVAEHAAVFDEVNRRLGEILGEVESGDDQGPA